MHPLRRKLDDIFWPTIIYGTTIILLMILLSPLWLWAVR
jgi:hypothetical protein